MMSCFHLLLFLVAQNRASAEVLENQRSVSAGAKYLFITGRAYSDVLDPDKMISHQLDVLFHGDKPSYKVVLLNNSLADQLAGRANQHNRNPHPRSIDEIVDVSDMWKRSDVMRKVYNVGIPGSMQDFYLTNQATHTLDCPDAASYLGCRTQTASNFAQMSQAVLTCASAPTSVELCVYLDPDIFLYSNASQGGMVQLMEKAFNTHENYVFLQPPTLCHDGLISDGACSVESKHFLASRHWFARRERLQRMLPIRWEVSDFTGMWEEQMSRKELNVTGQPTCGGAMFAIHPPSRFSPNQTLNTPHLLLNFLAQSEGASDHAEARGLDILLQRLRSKRIGKGSGTSGCHEMLTDEKRIIEEKTSWLELDSEARALDKRFLAVSARAQFQGRLRQTGLGLTGSRKF